jgi:hypothetical protein
MVAYQAPVPFGGPQPAPYYWLLVLDYPKGIHILLRLDIIREPLEHIPPAVVSHKPQGLAMWPHMCPWALTSSPFLPCLSNPSLIFCPQLLGASFQGSKQGQMATYCCVFNTYHLAYRWFITFPQARCCGGHHQCTLPHELGAPYSTPQQANDSV